MHRLETILPSSIHSLRIVPSRIHSLRNPSIPKRGGWGWQQPPHKSTTPSQYTRAYLSIPPICGGGAGFPIVFLFFHIDFLHSPLGFPYVSYGFLSVFYFCSYFLRLSFYVLFWRWFSYCFPSDSDVFRCIPSGFLIFP